MELFSVLYEAAVGCSSLPAEQYVPSQPPDAFYLQPFYHIAWIRMESTGETPSHNTIVLVVDFQIRGLGFVLSLKLGFLPLVLFDQFQGHYKMSFGD